MSFELFMENEKTNTSVIERHWRKILLSLVASLVLSLLQHAGVFVPFRGSVGTRTNTVIGLSPLDPPSNQPTSSSH